MFKNTKPPIWNEGENIHVGLTPEEALEIAEALLKATTEHPNCEFEVRFTEEDGDVKWFVKAKPTRPDAG
jgi:hypothetical protein